MSPQEKIPPAGINHYADKYWNDLPEIRAYLCRNATGDKNLWWIPYLKQRYAEKPFSNCLIIACGNGRIERELYDNGIALEFDAFDYSDTYLDEAKSKKGTRPINYFKSSFESLLLNKKYELVVNVAALHHVDCLDTLLKKISNHMPSYGIFVNWDYVGPNHNQYTEEHLKLMQSVNSLLPPQYQTKHPLRHSLDACLQGDITEAIRSSEIIPTFEKYFEVIEHHKLGGGIAYQLLWNNIEVFSKDDSETKSLLQKIIDLDETYTKNQIVPNLFAFFMGSPRHGAIEQQTNIANFYNGQFAELYQHQLEINATLLRHLQEHESRRGTKLKDVSLLDKIKKAFRQ